MTTLIKYPFDPTGLKHTNLVTDEIHTVTINNHKLVIPKHGMFFGISVILRNVSTGVQLALGTDYNPIELNQDYSTRTGKSVYQAIELNESIVDVELSFTYQVLGGDYSYSNENLSDKIVDISLPNVATDFNAITDRPKGYESSNHPHDIDEVYGMEYIASELDRIQNGIITSLYPSYLSLLSYIDNMLTDTSEELSDKINANLDNKLAEFLAKIDRTFLSIERIFNYSPSNYQEGKNVGNREFYITDLTENKFVTLESLVGLKDTMVNNLISKLTTGLGLDYSNYNLPLLATLNNLKNYARCTVVSYNQALFYEKSRDLTIYPATVGRDSELVMTKVGVDDTSSIITAVDSDKENLHITGLRDGQIKLNWNKYINTDETRGFITSTEIHLADFGVLNTTIRVPHNISKDHISLGYIENLPIVSKEEVLANVNANKYLTFDNLLVFMNNLFNDKADSFKPKIPSKTEYLIDNCVVVFSPPGFGSDQRCDFPDGNILTRKTTKPTTTVTLEPTKPIPPLGTLLGRVCDTYTLIGIYADGWGGSYTELILPNSPECGWSPPPTHIPKNTELSRNCNGTTLTGTYADGEGGTYDKMLEINSVACGYTPPLTNIPKGTLVGYTCNGENKLGVYADGAGGTYEGILEPKSPECGYAPDPAGIILQSDVCNYELFYMYNIVTDGLGGTKEVVTARDSEVCGFDPYSNCPPAGRVLRAGECNRISFYKYNEIADGTCGSYEEIIENNSIECGYTTPTPLPVTITISTLTTEITEKINNEVQISASVTNLVAGREYNVKWFLKNINDSDFVEQTTTYLNNDRTGTYVNMNINPTATGTVSVKARIVETLNTTKFFVSTPILIASKTAVVGPQPTISITSSKTTIFQNTATPVRLTAAVAIPSGSTKSYRVEWFSKPATIPPTTTYTSIGNTNLSTNKTSSEFDTSFNSAATGFISLQATLVNTSNSNDYVTSQPITITVEVKPSIGVPTVDLTISPSEVTVGGNDLLTLSASIGNLDTSYAYTVTWLVTQPGSGSDTVIQPIGDEISNTPTSTKSISPRSNSYFTTSGNARFGLRISRRNAIPAVEATDYVTLKLNPPVAKTPILSLTTTTAPGITILNNVATPASVSVIFDLTDFPASANNTLKMYRNNAYLEDVTIPSNAQGVGNRVIPYTIDGSNTTNFPNGPLVYEARYPLNASIKSNVTFNITRNTRTPRLILTNKLASNSISVSKVVGAGGAITTTITPTKAKFDIELREFDSNKSYSVLINRLTSTYTPVDNVTLTTNNDGNVTTTNPKEYTIPDDVPSGQLIYEGSVSGLTATVDYNVTIASVNKTFNMINQNANNQISVIDGTIVPSIIKIKLEVLNLAPSTRFSIPIQLNNNTNVATVDLDTNASGYAMIIKDLANLNGNSSLSNTWKFSGIVDNLTADVTYTVNRVTSTFSFTTTNSLTINILNGVPDVTSINFSLNMSGYVPNSSYIIKMYGNSALMTNGTVTMTTNINGEAIVPKSFEATGAMAAGSLEIKAVLYKLDGVTIDRFLTITFTVNKTTKTPAITVAIKSGYSGTINILDGTTAVPQDTMLQVEGKDFRANQQYNIEYVKPNSGKFAAANYITDGVGGFINAIQVNFSNPGASNYIALTGNEGSIQVRCNVVENGVTTTGTVTINVTKTTSTTTTTPTTTPPPTFAKTLAVAKTDGVTNISINSNTNVATPASVALRFTGDHWSASSYIIVITDNYGRGYPNLNVYPSAGSFAGPITIPIPGNTNSGPIDIRGSLDGLIAMASYTVSRDTPTPSVFSMEKSPYVGTINIANTNVADPSSFSVRYSVTGYTPYSNVAVTIYAQRPNPLNGSSTYLDSFSISVGSNGTGETTKTYYPDGVNWITGTLTLWASLDGGSTWPKNLTYNVVRAAASTPSTPSTASTASTAPPSLQKFSITAIPTSVSIVTDGSGNQTASPSTVLLRVAVIDAPINAQINADFYRNDTNGLLGQSSTVSSVFGAGTIEYYAQVIYQGKPASNVSALTFRFVSLAANQPSYPNDSVTVAISRSTAPTPAPTSAPTLTMWLDPTSVNISGFNNATVTIHYTASNFPPFSGTGRLVIVTKNNSSMYPPGGSVQYSFYINEPNVTGTYEVQIAGVDYTSGSTNINIGLDARPTIANIVNASLTINKTTTAPNYYPTATIVVNDNYILGTQISNAAQGMHHYLESDNLNLQIQMTGCRPNGVYNLHWLFDNIPFSNYDQPFNVASQERKTFDGSNDGYPAKWWVKVKADYKGEVLLNVVNGKVWFPAGYKSTGQSLFFTAVEEGTTNSFNSNKTLIWYCIDGYISSTP